MSIRSRSQRSSWQVHGLALAVFVALDVRCANGGGLREGDVLCEEAEAHLAACCPGYVSPDGLACEFAGNVFAGVNAEGGCTYRDHYPVFTADESRCILATTCAAAVSEGVCTRAQARPDAVAGDVPVGAPPPRPRAVCP